MDRNTIFYSDQDLAARYGVHRTTIWRWARRGQFPAPISLTDGGCTRWSGRDVEQWEENRLDRA